MNAKMTDAVVDGKLEAVKQATKYVKETENVAEKYSAMTVSKNSDMNMNVGELQSAAFTAVPTLKPIKKVRSKAQSSSPSSASSSFTTVGLGYCCGNCVHTGWRDACRICLL